MYLGDNKDGFAMIHEYGVGVTKDDLKYLEKYGEDGFYTYYGKMTKVAENIYAVDGAFPRSWNEPEELAGQETDFYAVDKGDKLYIVFQPVTDFENIDQYITEEAYISKHK